MNSENNNAQTAPESGIEDQNNVEVPEFISAFKEAITPIMPADLTALKEALEVAQTDVDLKLEGTSPREYQDAVLIRDAAKGALKAAESMTQEDSMRISEAAHKYLVSLHADVAIFDEKHGVSYKVAKTRKSSAAGVTQAEFNSIPRSDVLKYQIKYDPSTGEMTVMGHSCRTMSTWKRHAGITG